jgi:phasin
MYDKVQMEIPEAVRELAERNVEQAHAAYQQFMDMAHKAQEMVQKSQGVMAASALEIQSKAMSFAEQNIDTSFKFATDLARARDIKEYLEVQSRYAQKQIKTYSEQTQELARMMTDAAKSVKP